jgi:hypothetical protein
MKYVVTRLDRRHNGHLKFKYSVSPVDRDFIQSSRDFQAVREWAWSTYGPSMERDWAQSIVHVDKNDLIWAWDTEHGNKRLYLKSDAELTLFQLKFN